MKHLIIPGPPFGKERPRVVRGHAFTPEKTCKAEAAIAWLAKTTSASVLAGPVEFRAHFFTKNRVHADLDNMVKLAGDALNGIWWKDDRQIIRIIATVTEGDPNPRTELWADEA